LNVSALYVIPEAPIAGDGTFAVSNVLGEYEITIPGLTDGFRVQSVSRDDSALRGNRIGAATGEVVDRIVVAMGSR
jgi:hypothetical protein